MVKRITPAEASALLAQGWQYLDVRSVPEFDAGHPPGASNVPLLHAQAGRLVPNPAFERVVAAAFAKDAPIVVGCKTGSRSAQAAAMMEAMGYTSVADMRGGLAGERDALGRVTVPGWSAAGLAVEASTAPGKSWAELEKKG